MQFYHLDEIAEEQITLVVAATRVGEKWAFLQQDASNEWCMPFGRRLPGESPQQAVKRLLWEVLGTQKVKLSPVCICGETDYSLVYFAEAGPGKNYMGGLSLFDRLPEEPVGEAHRAIFHQVQAWRNLQTSSDEMWDIYDETRRPTGMLHRRGDPMPHGMRHLAIHVWIRQPDGRYLLTQRAPNKGYPGMWECTGGSALAGDDSLHAALREAKEETGLTLKPENGRMLLQRTGEDYYLDVWLFDQQVRLEDMVLQEGETVGKMFASPQTILHMRETGELVPFTYLEELFSLANT